jgi:hypothetical protein
MIMFQAFMQNNKMHLSLNVRYVFMFAAWRGCTGPRHRSKARQNTMDAGAGFNA